MQQCICSCKNLHAVLIASIDMLYFVGVACRGVVSHARKSPFFSPKKWGGHGRPGRPYAAGPEVWILVLVLSVPMYNIITATSSYNVSNIMNRVYNHYRFRLYIGASFFGVTFMPQLTCSDHTILMLNSAQWKFYRQALKAALSTIRPSTDLWTWASVHYFYF